VHEVIDSIEVMRTIGQGMRFTAVCIPPDARGGWSLKDLYGQEALDRDPAFRTRLGTALASSTGSTVYAPSVGFHSAAILPDARQLKRRIEFPNGITMYRNRELPADGVFLKPGQAFVMSAAGCMTAIAAGSNDENESFLLAFHMSRDSALDRKLILEGTASRPHRSVVEAAVDALADRGVAPEHMAIRGYFSLPPECFDHPFEHPEHGEYNQLMAGYVAEHWGAVCVSVEDTDEGESALLDMQQLLAHQAYRLGVRDVSFEHGLKLSGPFAHTRHPVERLRRERNLCIVHRPR
jgi:hypothetical protein